MACARAPLVEPMLEGIRPHCHGKHGALCFLLTGMSAAVLLSQVPSGGRRFLPDQGPVTNMFLGPTSASVGGTRVPALCQPAAAGARNPFGFRPPAHRFMQPVTDSASQNFMRPAAFRRFGDDPFDELVWHLTQPSKFHQDRKENLDFWPRKEPEKEPTETPEIKKGSSDLFHLRDPFKNISQTADLPVGRYVSRSFISKAHYGPDGRVVRERYASSAAGNGQKGIHEAKHVYSNSTSGLQKASHEQHLRGRSRLAVTEYGDGQQRESTQIFHGMNETENEAFGQEFDMDSNHLPGRAKLSLDALESPSHRLSSASRVHPLAYFLEGLY